jgi:hypothetical protein
VGDLLAHLVPMQQQILVVAVEAPELEMVVAEMVVLDFLFFDTPTQVVLPVLHLQEIRVEVLNSLLVMGTNITFSHPQAL